MAVIESTGESSLDAALARLRAPLGKALHAPGFVYSSPEMFAFEKENIFMRDWLFVAREEEIENPGDYLTLRVMGEPVILTRDGDGVLNACANVCVHRGVEVATGRGNTREFMCPYHGWLYDLNGRLVGAPYMKEAEGFDPKTCRLTPLRVGTWAGHVFINFDDGAAPFETFIAQLAADVGYLHPERCRTGPRVVLDLPCNWKFAVENLMDFYHVGVLHSGSFGAFFKWDTEKVFLRDNGGLYIKYTSASPSPEGKTLFRQLPWLEDEGPRFGALGYLAPHMHVFGRCDVVRPMQIWPIAPDRSQLVMYHLFPTEWHAEPDFREKCKVYYDYQVKVIEEDRSMLVSMQNAMTSRTYRPGLMSDLEMAIYNTLNYLVDRALGDRR